MSALGPDRRTVLAGLAAAAFAPVLPAGAASRERIAIVDWALLETALALGVTPMAAVELVLYRQLAVEPAVPDTVIDLGLRGSLNFELVATLSPTLIFGSNYSAWANDLLERIAPVRVLPIFEGEPPFEKAAAAMRAMGRDLQREAEAERYIAETDAELAHLADRLAPATDRPLLIVSLGDARHFRAFGIDSMFGDVAARLGFQNAWGTQTAYSATAPVGIEALADFPDAILVIVEPVPPDAERALPRSALYNAMPMVAAGRVVTLPTINPFGGLPAARRFARFLDSALAVNA